MNCRRSAVIDLGSNSVRLVVVETGGDEGFRIVDEERALLRLGARLAQDGALFGEAPRAQAVFAALVRRAELLGAERIRAVGTAALRGARDGPAFAAMLSRAAGIPLTVLDGEEEARLGFLGAINTMDICEGNLVDLGGASTEISCFSERRLRRARSLPLGAVTLQAALRGDPPGGKELAAAAERALGAIRAAWPKPQAGQPMVALGGSFRGIAKMHRAEVGYPFPSLHDYPLPPAAIAALRARAERLPLRERRKLPGLAAHRAELLVAALTIAQALVEWLRPSEIRVSGAGLREGVAFEELLGRDAVLDDVFAQGLRNLVFQLGVRQPPDYLELSDALFAALRPLVEKPRALEVGRAAARLRGAGARVNFYDRHRLTFDAVVHARMFGLPHRLQLLLAAAAAYEGPRRTRQLLSAYRSLLLADDLLLAQRLGLIAAYADALSRECPGARLAPDARITPALIALRLRGPCAPQDLPSSEKGRLEAQFAKVFGRKLSCRFDA